MISDGDQSPELEYQRILAEGKNEGKLAAARVLIEIGTDIDLIIKTTGLSELDVMNLKTRLSTAGEV